jgi:hypothetical protein
MRLPFPTRIPIEKMFIFAAVVFVVQLLERTNVYFAAIFFAYIMLSTIAFNVAGGFSRASGTYVFWFALLTCILGGLWKLFLAEPADSNLTSPVVTLVTYFVSMGMILCALKLSHRFTRNARGLSTILRANEVNLGHAAMGCFIASQLASYANEFLPHGNGSLTNMINQVNLFLPLAILLGTIHTIRLSGGRRSVSVLTVLCGGLIFVYGGLISYSKQAMFTPIVCWAAAAASQRFRLRLWQVALLAGFSVFSVTLLSPLSQVGRQIVPENATEYQRLLLSADLLSHPMRLRRDYIESLGTPDEQGRISNFASSYFDTPQGLFDRLTIIKADDRLVSYTLQGHTVGKLRVIYYFLDWIPHIILPNKEALMPPGVINSGNTYAHEAGGLLAPDDYSTGISFSPSAEAFHMDEWEGIVVVGTFVWTLLFISVDLICGDLRYSPFGLLALVAFAHVAPESLIGNLVYFIFFGNLGIVIAIVFCAYFAPILGLLLSPPQGSRIERFEPGRLTATEA